MIADERVRAGNPIPSGATRRKSATSAGHAARRGLLHHVAAPAESRLERAIAGDRNAMAQLIEHHGPVVRRGLQDKIPNRWRWRSILTVDDIMQVAYMNAYLNIGSLELKDEGSFRQWLATIAKRNLLDTVQMLQAKRRGGDRRRMGLGEGDSYVALCELLDGTTSTTSTPSRTAARNEACGALQRALQELPRIYRQVVQMYDLEGRAVGKVAEDLQRSPGAVYMLRARAHRLLRELMGTASKYLSD